MSRTPTGLIHEIGRITAVSRIPGTGRLLEVTKGHQPGQFRIRLDAAGASRTPEDTALTRFGTVRPRVQIPGPRPFLYSKSAISLVGWSRRNTVGSQFPRGVATPRDAVAGIGRLQSSVACETCRYQRQTSAVGWAGIAVVVAVLAVAIVGIIAITKVGINTDRRPRKPNRVRPVKGEYQPPEPPEGRYWG